MTNESKLVVLRDFLNKAEAELAQGALKAQGVDSIVQADDAGGEEPGLWMGGVKLLVRAHDAERARKILGPAK
jgi:Putative prokaryotic signal transducing protein